MQFKVIICLFMLVILSGCASTRQFVPLPDQTKETEDPTKSRIYVMRPSTFGGAISMEVKDGDVKIGKTGPKGYLSWEREPGEAKITSQAENEHSIDLVTEQGIAYYILQHVYFGFIIARTKLELLLPEKGREILNKCKAPEIVLIEKEKEVTDLEDVVPKTPSEEISLKRKIGLGLGYPYVSLKYNPIPVISLELRGAFDSGIRVFGGRMYYNFHYMENAVIYSGLEIDHVTFNTEGISGDGHLVLIFIGGENFISKNSSVCFDIGPVYTKLIDSDYSDVTVSGIDWVVNVGFNFYFR